LGLPAFATPGPLPPGLAPGFILAVGTVEPRKNYPRLLAAYRHLRRGSVPLLLGDAPGVPELVIAGRPGWAYGDTLERIKTEPGVRYLGHVDEATLSALYRSAAVLALPSLYEGFGLPLLEAMANGLPAVVGNVGALPELADGAAILVEPEDVSSIAAGLERVLGDAALREKLGAEGRRRAAEFTWERAASTTRDVLRHIASPGAKAPAGRTIS
jgi:glycosyltransferase involved in cell wall biosynthesis